MKIWFLGTSAGYPTAERGCLGILIDNEILLECGENVAQKIQKIGGVEGLHSLNKILITHGHGDHLSGFPTLVWSMWLTRRTRKLTLIGPEYINEKSKLLLEATLTPILPFEIQFMGVTGVKGNIGDILFLRVEHSVESYAYRYKGVCYTGDTRPSKELVEFTKGCHTLIHECSFHAGEEKYAHSLGHSTSADAAKNALLSKVKRLVLTHWPGDKKNGKLLMKEASEIFDGEVILAEDMKFIEV
ncbi:MAG: MBL fold metallo-hydrolase [Candidatus Odinarchaeia archaeon]